MHAALVTSWSIQAPIYTRIGQLQLKILAGSPQTGVSYYILPLSALCLAESVNVDRGNLVLLQPGAAGPESESLDPVAIAGLVNPVSSSLMALRTRVNGEITGKTVLVLGATGKSGRAAVLVAKFLGCVDGVDGWVASGHMPTGATGGWFSLSAWVGPVHIVLDYVGGSVGADILGSAEIEDGEELQYVQVENLAFEMGTEEKHMFEILPGHLISRRPICIRGSGMGSFSRGDLICEIPDLISFLAGIKAPFEIASAPVSQVASVWRDENTKGSRLVILP
ncbi:hypothetical protein BJX96DRAFT_169204 [Aspergillus floccosus]